MNKVVHCITTISRGGAENQLLILAREQIAQNLDVSVIYLKGNPELASEFDKVGVTILRDVANKNPIIQVLKIWKINRNSVHIFHAHLPRAELIASFTKGINPLILSKHNSEPFFPKAPKLVSRFIARFVNSKADLIICISNAVKNFIIGNGEISNQKKLKVNYYGADQNKFEPNKEIQNLKKDLGIEDKFVFGTVARLENQKDFPTMIHAFANLTKLKNNATLLIVGNGSLEKELKELSVELSISKNIVWVGKVLEPRKYMELMDVFVLTSKYEGFGLVMVEAMQVGIPILAANNSSIPEVLGSNYMGLFKTGDNLALFLKMQESLYISFREKLTAGFEGRLHLFNATIMAENILKIYKAVSSK